jgi:oligopeptide transport system ATP-binding protein
MYAGSVVETATTDAIFAGPKHPYTAGLMRSIPSLEQRRQKRLQPIRGLPPSLVDLPAGCPFAPRCDHARDQCRAARPPLMEVASGHRSACWFWGEVATPAPDGPARSRPA